MKNQEVYLKPNLVLEPLVDRWYAWSHIISPGTASLNMVERHMKIMNSYVKMPQIHQEAVKNPKLLGGPFIDYDRDRTEEIKELIATTLEKQSNLIEFGAAIRELNETLVNHANGVSMEELYGMVPDLLRGYVELVYDLNNNASFRFIEQLLYNSSFYSDKGQSVSLWLTDNDSRPFVLSTPRLNDSTSINLEIPFKSEAIDMLSKMKSTPRAYEEIRDILNIKKEDEALFKTFFTEKQPEKYANYEGDLIRMRYFGHACILVETKNVSILVDPLISYYGYQSDVEHFSDFDLPDTIDYVLITHNHQDHILLETLLPLRHKIKNVVVPRSGGGSLQDPSLKLMFNEIGFKNVIEVDEMETLTLEDCTIQGVPFTGEHSDLDIKAKSCFSVKIDDFSLLFMADSRVLEPKLYEHVQAQIGNIDVLFLGMECDGAPLSWLYGPLMLTDVAHQHNQSRRLSGSDCAKGMSVINIFKPAEVYVYAMGQEPWCEFISSIKYTDESNPIVQSNMLIKECESQGVIAERLYGEKEILYSRVKEDVLV